MFTCHARGVDQTAKERTDISKDPNQELQIVERFFIPLKDKSLANYIPSDKFMESPAFPIYLTAKNLGFTTSVKDIDGSLRKIQLFSIYKEFLVPQLSLPIIFDEFNIDKNKIEIKPGHYVKLTSVDGKTIFKIPVQEDGEMYINWSKKWTENPFGINLPFSFLVEYYDDNKTYKQYLSYLTNKDVSEEDKKTIREQINILEPILAELSNKISIVKGKITITGWTAEASTDRGMITIDPLCTSGSSSREHYQHYLPACFFTENSQLYGYSGYYNIRLPYFYCQLKIECRFTGDCFCRYCRLRDIDT